MISPKDNFFVANFFIYSKLASPQECPAKRNWHVNCSLSEGWKEVMASSEKKILIIDPDPRERRELAARLEDELYTIDTGKNLSEAIKKITEGNYHCLLMEVDLPEMKGYEAVSIVKSLDPKLRIIMMTKKNSKKLEAKVRAQDIFFYFIKSFGLEELKLAIKNAFIPDERRNN
jgi:DNA-binding NtrC family response regulator